MFQKATKRRADRVKRVKKSCVRKVASLLAQPLSLCAACLCPAHLLQGNGFRIRTKFWEAAFWGWCVRRTRQGSGHPDAGEWLAGLVPRLRAEHNERLRRRCGSP